MISEEFRNSMLTDTKSEGSNDPEFENGDSSPDKISSKSKKQNHSNSNTFKSS